MKRTWTGILKRSKIKRKVKTSEEKQEQVENIAKMFGLYTEHWNSKPHVCESCGVHIWGECKSLYHDHLLDKGISRYAHLMYEIKNLYLVCEDCHTKKGSGYPTEKHKQAIDNAHKQFNV